MEKIVGDKQSAYASLPASCCLQVAVAQRGQDQGLKVSDQREYRSAPSVDDSFIGFFRIHNPKCIVLYSKVHDVILFIKIFIIPRSWADGVRPAGM